MTDPIVRYEVAEPGIARITLARADKHNAINPQMIFEVNDAFDKALRDNDVKVIILDAEGRNFSAGHDIADSIEEFQASVAARTRTVGTWSDYQADATHGWYSAEKEVYFETAKRWRNISKPTICAVQGKCIAGALIFAWVCDIIIASDDALFSDPVMTFGMPGVEWLGHPWELGARKAKEFLFTSDSWGAEEAKALGMVNHVVPRTDLLEFSMAMARKIANKPPFALKLAKEAVNKALDIQGQADALDAGFYLHHLGHSQNFRAFGWGMDPTHVPGFSSSPKNKA